MTDRDKLIEAMARAICEYETPESYDDLPEISMIKKYFRATAQAALAAIEAAGFAVVPLEPTEAMMRAGDQEMPNPTCLVSAYRAMLAAAPMQGGKG
jgi:hypothetical protein